MADSDDENGGPSKRINVNASTLVDLKAELAKKRDEFNRQKLTNVPRVRPQKTVVKNKGVEERNSRDLSDTPVDSDKLQESRKALERKAKLYEQLKEKSLQDDDDTPSPYLVDFEQKAVREIQDIKQAKLKELEKEESESESDSYHSDESGRDPDDEWVEYVDCLGRTRTCLRRDLDHYKRVDKKLTDKPKVESESESKIESVSAAKPLDPHHEQLKEKWAETAESNKHSSSLHYENVRFDEIRDHGTGFYKFSTDEQTRLEQRRLLDELRDKTIQQRKKSRSLKEKRKRLKKERLKRVRRRKRIRMGLDPDVTDEEDNKSSDSDKDPLSIPVKTVKPTQDTDIVTNKEKTIREWDIGKTAMGLEQIWAEKKEILRQDRQEEFAPPSFY